MLIGVVVVMEYYYKLKFLVFYQTSFHVVNSTNEFFIELTLLFCGMLCRVV